MAKLQIFTRWSLSAPTVPMTASELLQPECPIAIDLEPTTRLEIPGSQMSIHVIIKKDISWSQIIVENRPFHNHGVNKGQGFRSSIRWR